MASVWMEEKEDETFTDNVFTKSAEKNRFKTFQYVQFDVNLMCCFGMDVSLWFFLVSEKNRSERYETA